jgi:ATP-dependent HslUV protease subunit HslV
MTPAPCLTMDYSSLKDGDEMSTIVVVRKGKSASMAADTLTSFGEKRLSERFDAHPEKILLLGKCVVGLIGSPVHRLVLQSLDSAGIAMPEIASRSQLFDFLREIHPKLKDDYFLNPVDDPRDPYETNHMDMLVMTKYGIFGALSLREAYEYNRFWALGSGAEYALGAMQTVYGTDMTADQIAKVGVEAACVFDSGSAAETVSVKSLDLCSVQSG